VTADERRDAEQARLDEMMAVSGAESTVASARIADLKAEHDHARRRWITAKGQLTRARKDGSAEKIARWADIERRAYAEFDRIGRESIEEALTVNGARLDATGELLGQLGRTWDADAAALREATGRDPESGQ
jgi:hypothetical protein